MRTIQCLVPALLAMAGLANAQDFSALSSCAVGDFASHMLAVLQFAFVPLRIRSHDRSLLSPNAYIKAGNGGGGAISRVWLGHFRLGSVGILIIHGLALKFMG